MLYTITCKTKTKKTPKTIISTDGKTHKTAIDT